MLVIKEIGCEIVSDEQNVVGTCVAHSRSYENNSFFRLCCSFFIRWNRQKQTLCFPPSDFDRWIVKQSFFQKRLSLTIQTHQNRLNHPKRSTRFEGQHPDKHFKYKHLSIDRSIDREFTNPRIPSSLKIWRRTLNGLETASTSRC